MSYRQRAKTLRHCAPLLAAVLAAGCDREPAPPAEVQVVTVPVPPVAASQVQAPPAPPPSPASVPTQAAAVQTSSELGFYPRDGIQPVDDTCQNATVVLHLIPKAVCDRPSFRWRFAENELAAAYMVTVPTSQPELFCGSAPSTIRRLGQVEIVPWDRAKIGSALPDKADVVAQCVEPRISPIPFAPLPVAGGARWLAL